jgi:excisionase family DNA binding protein
VRRWKRTETTIESHEVWVIRRARRVSPEWCDLCAGQAGMLTPDEAALWKGVSTRTVYRWVEGGRLHFTEMADGSLLICLASLAAGAA